MATQEQFLSQRKRYQPIALPHEFSDEEMARDWTLSEEDCMEIDKYSTTFRLFVAVQLCAVRLYGRFLNAVPDLSPRILNYLGSQLGLPPSLTIEVPDRKATYTEHRKSLLDYLGFQKFEERTQAQLTTWLNQQAQPGVLPEVLFQQAEQYLLAHRILLPGPSVLERLVIHICSNVHEQLFARVFHRLPPDVQRAIDQLLTVPEGEQRSHFYRLKEYPPAATISSLQAYLERYQTLSETGIAEIATDGLTPAFLEYLFKLAKRYSATDLKRFADHKRYTLMLGFLLETRKVLLDHLVQMHDQYLLDLCRHAKNAYEDKHRALRKQQKRAIDIVLDTTHVLLDWPDEAPLSKAEFWQQVDERSLRGSLEALRTFKRLKERGYGDLLLARYPSLRKYFAAFLHLPFAVAPGNERLLQAIELVRQLDAGAVKKLPAHAPTAFVPPELHRALKDASGTINRNAWETGLALAIKDALRSGDLYLPQSKHHVSFWDLTLSETRWQEVRTTAYATLHQPQPQEVRATLPHQFQDAMTLAQERFSGDAFATIEDGRLKLKRDDKMVVPAAVTTLQKVIDTRLPSIRIEQLLMEVDQLTQFSRHFTPLQNSQSRPQHFYRTLLATLISQATKR